MLSSAPSRRELIVWIAATALVVFSVGTLRNDPAGAGTTPTPTTRVAYLATGANFPDALGAGPAAALGLGPILLVQQNAIPAETLAELNRLQPDEVFLVGGTGVISDAVGDAVEALSFKPTVTRLAGGNRYATAAAVSQETFPTSGFYPRAVWDGDDNLTDGNGSGIPVEVMTAFIEAPAPGILIVAGGMDVKYLASSAGVTCNLHVSIGSNGVHVEGSNRQVAVSSTNPEEDCDTTVAKPVAAGIYTIGFVTSETAAVARAEGSLWAIWIPFGGYGQTLD